MGIRRDRQDLPEILTAARDAAVAFLEGLPRRPAARRPPAEHLAPNDLPERGVGALAAVDRFRSRFEEGLSGSAGPRYLGFVTGGSTPAAVAGDWLAAAYDQNLSNDGDSIATAVELETLGMLRSLFGLGDAFHGAFVSGATQANVVSLAAAREWAAQRQGVDLAADGLYGLPPIPVLGGTPHASVEKALSILGMGRRIEIVPCLPGRRSVDPQALDRHLESLDGAPAIVIASAGEVNTGDFDDLAALGEICRRRGAWLHVDGAFGLFAACDPDRSHLLKGLESADSLATDGHKWLNVPYDSGLVFTRHLGLQERVFHAVAAYLGDGPDLLHRTPENSRRFRALPAWMTLVAYGRDGYRELIRQNCAQAEELGRRLDASKHFDLLAPVRLNIVCFALARGGTAERDQLLSDLVDDGRAFLTPTVFNGRPGLRAAFSNATTTDTDVGTVARALEELVQKV
ncbi:MAG: pyridoxal-dependent decarboxylase [Acidobacteriota bacterium]